MKNLLTGLGLLLALAGFGQKIDSTTNFWSNWTFKPIVAGQMWVSYTEGARIYDPASMVYEDVDGRTNFVIRRTRLGAAVAPNENFTGI